MGEASASPYMSDTATPYIYQTLYFIVNNNKRLIMKNMFNKVMNNVEIEEVIEMNSDYNDVDVYEECDLCEVFGEVE